jgi:hypothetical protein
MNPVEIMSELETHEVELWVEDDNLRFRGPKEVMTPDVINKLKKHKTQLIKLIETGYTVENLQARVSQLLNEDILTEKSMTITGKTGTPKKCLRVV